MPHRPLPIASILVTVPLFAAFAGLSRYTFRSTETRWQIAAFAALAIGAEGLVRLGPARRASAARGLANAAAAAIVIVLVKFHLEPVARVQDKAAVKHVARQVVRAVRDTP